VHERPFWSLPITRLAVACYHSAGIASVKAVARWARDRDLLIIEATTRRNPAAKRMFFLPGQLRTKRRIKLPSSAPELLRFARNDRGEIGHPSPH